MKTLALTLLSSTLVGGVHAASLRSQIDAANARIAKLMMARDVKGVVKATKMMTTPDFKYMEAGRIESLDTMCANMAMGIGQMKSLAVASAKTLTLSEKGSTATATTLHTMKGTTMGADHKPHALLFSGTSTDTYVKQGGKWRMSSMAWGEQTMTLDGKPMGGMASAPAKG